MYPKKEVKSHFQEVLSNASPQELSEDINVKLGRRQGVGYANDPLFGKIFEIYREISVIFEKTIPGKIHCTCIASSAFCPPGTS
jgi:hypothetical protein